MFCYEITIGDEGISSHFPKRIGEGTSMKKNKQH